MHRFDVLPFALRADYNICAALKVLDDAPRQPPNIQISASQLDPIQYKRRLSKLLKGCCLHGRGLGTAAREHEYAMAGSGPDKAMVLGIAPHPVPAPLPFCRKHHRHA